MTASAVGAGTIREIEAACRRAGVRDVDTSRRHRAEYSSDASLYRVVPAAVVAPRDAEQVAAVLEIARTVDVPVTARGGGTSIAGNAVGPGIVLDVARHMNRIRQIDGEACSAVVEPGVILSDLQVAVGRHGLRFGPDPSSLDRCTIGGMIGNDACGARALRYGRTSDNVAGLDVVTGAGDELALGPVPHEPTTDRVVREVLAQVGAEQELVRAEFGRFGRQASGYPLQRLLPEQGPDVVKALVGTEGTCAVVTRATVSLVRSPAATCLVVLAYPDIGHAADAVPEVLEHEPVAIEGLDARIVAAAKQAPGAQSVPELPDGQGWLLVEVSGDDDGHAAARAADLVRAVDAQEGRIVPGSADAAQLWGIRRDGSGRASRSPAGKPAHSGWEDAAVPPERLGDYLRDFDALLVDHGLTAIPYGHFGDGCMHVRVDVDLSGADGKQRLRRFLEDAAGIVVSYGGSMSGEHGDGRARSELLRRMYSPAALDLMSRVKRCFDPAGVLNPGIVVDPAPLDEHVRLLSAGPVRDGLGFAYSSDRGNLSEAVHRCVGIGACRADRTAAGKVMCPSFVATRNEKDSTRGRARVLQEVINGGLITDGWRAPEVQESLDLCLACKACSAECPAGVDMATYKAEVLYQAYRGRLRPRAHYALGRLPTWLRMAGRFPNLVNAVGTIRPAARLLAWAAGMDPRRPLPKLARTPLRRRRRPQALRSAAHSPAAPVAVLWVDTFTDGFDPDVADAAAELLTGAGYRVTLPGSTGCCGLTLISTGQLDRAKRMLGSTVRGLAAAARDGAIIVGLEPSCTAVLRHDARELLGAAHQDAHTVAVATRTLAEALTERRPEWEPPRLDGLEVIAQPHCHHRSVLGWDADAKLLTEAGATVRELGGCCGLAGNFGMEKGHYDVSVAVAETALLPALRSSRTATVLADGFSCRTQVEQLAGRPTLHLAQLLTRQSPRIGSTG